MYLNGVSTSFHVNTPKGKGLFLGDSFIAIIGKHFPGRVVKITEPTLLKYDV